MGGQKGGMGVSFAFGREAEGDGHYFGFAEEESGIFCQFCCAFGAKRRDVKRGELLTCCPIVASGRL